MKGTKRQQTLAIFAIACIVLLAGKPLVISPLKASWDARSKRLAKVKSDFKEGTSRISRESSIRRQWDNIRDNALPDEKPQAEGKLSEAFQRWANASNISVNGIRPSWKDGVERNRKVEYRTLEWRVDASGSLANLTRFLFEVENDPMGLKVESVDLTSRDEYGSQLQLSLEVSALQLVKTQTTP
jgi:hypothetical protein